MTMKESPERRMEASKERPWLQEMHESLVAS